MLGFDVYTESFTDGLQILRYNETTAYNSHMDWMQPSLSSIDDYQSYGTGGNRFATILLYLSDMNENEGGETVFPKAPVDPTTTRETELQVSISFVVLRLNYTIWMSTMPTASLQIASSLLSPPGH